MSARRRSPQGESPHVGSADAPSFERAAESLETVLIGLLQEEQRLLECIRRQRDAIKTGRLRDVPLIASEEQVIVRRVKDLDSKRQQSAIVARDALARRTGRAPTNEVPVLSMIVDALDEPARSRLSAIAEQLRTVAVDVRRESSIVRQAADALGKHLSGLVMTVNSALSRAGVYGRQGRVLVGETLECAVDLRS